MAVAVPLRCDFDAAQLRALAKRSRDPDQTRRLLALAAIYDGACRPRRLDRLRDAADRARLGAASKLADLRASGPAGHQGPRRGSPMRIARPWWPGSMRARSRPSTAWCAGASPEHPAQSRRKISFLEENGEEHLCTDLHHSPTAGNDRSRSYGFVLIVGAAAQFGVKKVLTIPLNRRITAKLTVKLSGVPFGCTACRKAVRSPWMHSPK